MHLRWDGVWQRPHHILSRLSRRVPVIVIEEPFILEGEERDEIRHDGNVTIIRPIRTPLPDGPFVDARTIATTRGLLDGAQPTLWLYQPLMLALADAFAEAPLVYDCMDDLGAFAFAPDRLREDETLLLERAYWVFCGGRTLYEARRSFGEKVKLYPSGVDFTFFAAARSLAPHPLVQVLPRPRYGYVGVIDERLDYGLIDALSADAGNPTIIMIGPVMKIDAAQLPRKPNVHFTGKQPYAAIPSILAGLDVALMPFALNASTRAISPTKTLEYLAAGLPVVSTPISDVVTDYGGVVTIAEGAEFLKAAARLCHPEPFDSARYARYAQDRLRRGMQIAELHDWQSIVDRMWADVASVSGLPQR